MLGIVEEAERKDGKKDLTQRAQRERRGHGELVVTDRVSLAE
jgi:hypothetical protein